MKSLTQYIVESKRVEPTPKDVLAEEVATSKFPKDFKYNGDTSSNYADIDLSGIKDSVLKVMFAEINGALYQYQGVTTGLKNDASYLFNAQNVKALAQDMENREYLEEEGIISKVKSYSENGRVLDLYFLTHKGEAYIKAFFNSVK